VFYLLFIILGGIWGSFSTVCIYRLPENQGIIPGRSFCPSCKNKIQWFDNIPILSFLFLRGRCRCCRQRLSWQYPLVEAGTGAMFVLMAKATGFFSTSVNLKGGVNLFFFLALGFIFAAIFLWDVKYMIIPDQLIGIGLVLEAGYYLFQIGNGGCNWAEVNCGWLSGLLGGLIIGGFFYFLFLISRGKWIGGGDVKLGFLLGGLIGWRLVYGMLLTSYLTGSLVALALIVAKKKKISSKLAFGPFLIVGTMIALLFKMEILFWQNRLFF